MKGPDSKSSDWLVVVDDTGVAHPRGGSARSEMAALQGVTMELLPSPSDVVIMREPRATRRDGHAWLAGELTRAASLHDVCAMMGQARWRGELVVSNEEATRTIVLNDGQVVGAWSNAPSERLGAVLTHFGVLTSEQIEQTSRSTGHGMRFGDAAVHLGFIDRETLFRHLHRQTEMIVYAAVAVGKGTFSFTEGYDDTQLTFPISVPLHGLLMEGVRRMDELQVFRTVLPSDAHVPVRLEERSIAPDDPALSVFLAIDGIRSVAQIAARVEQDVFQTTRLLYELTRKGVVAIRAPRGSGPEAVVSTFNEVITLILSEVDQYRGASADIRESLASFAASGVVYEPIFRGAGPSADGTLDPAVVHANLASLEDVTDPERTLAEMLYEYASFAMFISEPVLRAGAQSDAGAVSSRVAALLAPLAPEM